MYICICIYISKERYTHTHTHTHTHPTKSSPPHVSLGDWRECQLCWFVACSTHDVGFVPPMMLDFDSVAEANFLLFYNKCSCFRSDLGRKYLTKE